MRSLKGQSILESQQFDREILDDLFMEADNMQGVCKFLDGGDVSEDAIHECGIIKAGMAEKKIALLFYEPSTRTWSSFYVAAENLGARVMAIPPARQFSSVVKGETVKDTIAMFCGYGIDAIVMRSDKEGMAKEADDASHSNGRQVSIINAGDGAGQHPTQALLDLYTIKRFFENDLKKDIHKEKINIVFAGDLANGRTVRSLAYLLNKYQDPKKIEFFFVSPTVLKMRDDIKEYLNKKGVKFSEYEKLIDVADKADVCYMTRVQKERLDGIEVDYDFIRSNCSINEEVVKKMKKEAIVMHPLPRDPAFGEIPEWFDSDPRAKYIQQAENGLYVRMALLKKVLLG
ncbi:MAG: aspartate carbamoyltransferase [Candidatus Moranbacteria bacterium RIFOXYB1_FULL_43_19]|nr:MAG: aspartate carbamoyltransferase [Candidatus Moranbacteria bacterium RIFOXYA1_FULL_44_7]OGI27866.1 MAG: aspartate carbamoyltransferase [Candidatus Moranbacteria bacterium RIFOXYB1_FULL_43_19]OGI34060.1 MAG: aspartate carbamoyltransferase [Candidatus Moranbacteria bacterium RIFOXYC1_FULL_44_13]OGI37918.1 MAG: aspartate carbamoyltransferase [Candidatus Moranbacteria bacterium RIFOXYD1_FULL_44_12]